MLKIAKAPLTIDKIRSDKKHKGSLITFSGIDGAGKSTQINLLSNSIRRRQRRTTVLWLRGGYTPKMLAVKARLWQLGGRKILPTAGKSAERDSVLGNYFVRKLWLCLAVLELFWITCVQLRYKRWSGEHVICDRYIWDSIIDFQLNFPQEEIERWWIVRLLFYCSLKPNVAILMLLPLEVSIERCCLKADPFPNSPENVALRYALYERLPRVVSNCAERWLNVDATVAVDLIYDKVWEAVSQVVTVSKT